MPAMTRSTLCAACRVLIPTICVCAMTATYAFAHLRQPADDAPALEEEKAINIQYLEIVTHEVEATCDALEKLHGVQFSEPDALLGGARTAPMSHGGKIGVRAPMHDAEEPVVRPYIRVDDAAAAVETAKAAGGEIAMGATELPGHGTFGIYFQGGNQFGLWQ